MANDLNAATAPGNLWSDDQRGWSGAPPRGFGEAISACLSNYATFSGRASRSEFWWFSLAVFIAAVVGMLIHQVIYFIVILAVLLPSWAVSARRLHDVNRSGWWMLLNIIPGGALLLLYWFCKAPVDPNDFGA